MRQLPTTLKWEPYCDSLSYRSAIPDSPDVFQIDKDRDTWKLWRLSEPNEVHYPAAPDMIPRLIGTGTLHACRQAAELSLVVQRKYPKVSFTKED